MLTQAASSEMTERLVHEVLTEGQYRKHLAKLRSNLQRVRGKALRRLESIGLSSAGESSHGLFAWVDVAGVDDTTALAEAAVERSILLAPGAMFRPNLEPSSKMRFNLGFCHGSQMLRQLEELLAQARRSTR